MRCLGRAHRAKNGMEGFVCTSAGVSDYVQGPTGRTEVAGFHRYGNEPLHAARDEAYWLRSRP